MPVNADKPDRWKHDIAQSIDCYNEWFIRFAPETFRRTRANTATQVAVAVRLTDSLRNLSPEVLRQHPEILPILRMSTAPPIARDRLIGLAQVSPGLVLSMEQEHRVPSRRSDAALDRDLAAVTRLLTRLLDADLFPWIHSEAAPSAADIYRAATIVADRLCGAIADPLIRNAQEQRQIAVIKAWLEGRLPSAPRS